MQTGKDNRSLPTKTRVAPKRALASAAVSAKSPSRALPEYSRDTLPRLAATGRATTASSSNADDTEDNPVEPGGGVRGFHDGREAEAAAIYPLARLGVPEDVSGVVAFLLSADAAWITGQTIVIDGGATIS